jgi:hypothetical protein
MYIRAEMLCLLVIKHFYEITTRLLTSYLYNVDEEMSKASRGSLDASRNIRDSIKIAKMAKHVEDVNWLVTTFLKGNGSAPFVPEK